MGIAVPASDSPNGIPTPSAANSTVRRFLTAPARQFPPAGVPARAISFGPQYTQNANSTARTTASTITMALPGVKIMVW
jgi:hypothetical protein